MCFQKCKAPKTRISILFFLAFQPLSFLKRPLLGWHDTPVYRACINRSGCNISITETPIKIVQWLLGQSVTPNKKEAETWCMAVGGKNNTGRMSVKRTNSKKQTQADICIGHG